MLRSSKSDRPCLLPDQTVLVDLALQGGGSHGAFTWGVLDRLLEESWLSFDGISGTSAGAMNAAVMASGYAARRRRRRARPRSRTSGSACPTPRSSARCGAARWKCSPASWTLDYSPMYLAAEMASRIFSPYDLNPLGNNPLRPILAEMVDFEALAESPIKLFITATNVRTGAGRVFRNAEITPDVLLASGCLPTMFQAVEIDGEFYWDGGYSGNPTITPLVRECQSQRHDPGADQPDRARRDPAQRARHHEPAERGVVQRAAAQGAAHDRAAAQGGRPGPGRRRAVGRHAPAPHRHRARDRADSSSKMITEWRFLCGLRDEGRRTASLFLEAHAADLGKRSTLDLDALLATL